MKFYQHVILAAAAFMLGFTVSIHEYGFAVGLGALVIIVLFDEVILAVKRNHIDIKSEPLKAALIEKSEQSSRSYLRDETEETKKYKDLLSKGILAVGNRYTGKTTALLEYISDELGGKAIVLTHSDELSRILEARYRQEFVGRPRFVSASRDWKEYIQGYQLPVFADEINLFDPEVRAEVLRYPYFKGGVTS